MWWLQGPRHSKTTDIFSDRSYTVKKMLQMTLFVLLALVLSTMSACDQEGNPLSETVTNVVAIKFCVFETGARQPGTLSTLSTVTNHEAIREILTHVDVGREQPFSKHIFTKTLVLVKLDGSTIRIPFEDRNGLMSIRFGSKQYQTDRQTIDLLNRYYSTKVKETP